MNKLTQSCTEDGSGAYREETTNDDEEEDEEMSIDANDSIDLARELQNSNSSLLVESTSNTTPDSINESPIQLCNVSREAESESSSAGGSRADSLNVSGVEAYESTKLDSSSVNNGTTGGLFVDVLEALKMEPLGAACESGFSEMVTASGEKDGESLTSGPNEIGSGDKPSVEELIAEKNSSHVHSGKQSELVPAGEASAAFKDDLAMSAQV